MRIRKRPAQPAGEPATVVGSMSSGFPVKRVLLGLLIVAVLAGGAYAGYQYVYPRIRGTRATSYSKVDQVKDFGDVDSKIIRGGCDAGVTKTLDGYVSEGKQPRAALAQIRQGRCLMLALKYQEAVDKLTPAVASIQKYTFEDSANEVLSAKSYLARAQQEVQIKSDFEHPKAKTNTYEPNQKLL